MSHGKMAMLALGIFGLWESVAFGAAHGFAWYSGSGNRTIANPSAYGYMSRGSSISVVREGTGQYLVRFLGMTSGTQGGNIQVTAYNRNPTTCQVRNWYVGSDGLNARVLCFDNHGVRKDSAFSVMGTRRGVQFHGVFAYAWVNSSAAAPDTYSFNPTSQRIDVERHGIGHTTVSFLGLQSYKKTVPLITTYGSTPGVCQPVAVQDDHTVDFARKVQVLCWDMQGRRRDFPYSIFMGNYTFEMAANYVEIRNPSSSTPYSVPAHYRDLWSTPVVTRNSLGSWTLSAPPPSRYPDLSSTSVQVSPYGFSPTLCAVQYWSRAFRSSHRCWRLNGTAVDFSANVFLFSPDRF